MKCVYKIEDKKGRIYIGSTKNLEKRWGMHKSGLKHNRHHNVILQRVYDKHGLDYFTCEVVEECDNLFEREQYYIDTLKPFYNIGGVGGGDNITNNPRLEEIREKHRQNIIRQYKEGTRKFQPMYGEDNPNWRGGRIPKCSCGAEMAYNAKTCGKCRERTGGKNPFFGKVHSEETRKRLSELGKERAKHSKPKNSRKISADGVIYDCCADCARALGISNGLINYRVKSPKYDYFYIT